MEHKKIVLHRESVSAALAIALGSALICLLVCTFLLCSSLVQQLLPLIAFSVFLPLAALLLRMRRVKAHAWMFYALCLALAVACGLLFRAVF